MLAVSNAFNEAFKSDLREVKMRIKINDVTYTDEDIISFNFNSGSIVGETFAIGSTYANSIKLTLCKIVEGLKQLDEVIPEMGIVLPDGSIEWVKLGTFIISEEVNPDRNENRTSLECTDKMIMLDDIYESKLNYPAKIRDVALEIANLAGVEVEPVSFGRLMENTIQKPVGYTYRQALGLIAQFEAGYACFDRNGLFAIRQLEDKDYQVTPNEYFQNGLTKNELKFRPAGIQVKVSDTSEDDKVLKIGNEKGSVIRLENKVMTDGLLKLVYDKVKNINYYPYTLKWRGNPAVEVGDWLQVTDTKGNLFKVPNLSYSFEYKGGLTATSTVETVASNEVRFGYKGILNQVIQYVDNSIKNIDGSVIYYGVEAPPSPKEGDTWFKYVDSDTEIWVYEKISEPDVFDWVFKISSAVDNSIKEKIDELEQQSKDQQINIDKALSDAGKAIEEAEVARQEAFDSSTIAKQAEKDALNALLKGDQNSTQITTIEGQQKLTNTKVEGNTANILNLQTDSEKLSLSIGKVQADVENIDTDNLNLLVDSINQGMPSAMGDRTVIWQVEDTFNIKPNSSATWMRFNTTNNLSIPVKDLKGRILSLSIDVKISTVSLDSELRLITDIRNPSLVGNNIVLNASSEWQRFVIEIPNTKDIVEQDSIMYRLQGKNFKFGDVISFRKPKIFIGKKSKEWTPSIQDFTYQQEFSSFEQTVKGFQTTVENQVEGLQSQQTQMAGQITDVVSSVNNGTSSGFNLIPNGSFENGNVGWSELGTIANRDSYAGTNHYYSSAKNAGEKKVLLPITVTPGRLYEFSYWYQTSSDANGTIMNQKLRIGSLNYSHLNSIGWDGANTSWTQNKNIWRCPNDVTSVRISLVTNHTVGWVRFDDVSMIDVTDRETSKSKVIQLSDQITQTVNKVETVDGKVTKQQSQITQLSNNINLKVDKDNVIAQINLSPESIRLDAKFIHLSGKSLIDDAVIKTAHIDNLAVTGAKIQDATISTAKIISLDADKINASTLSAITSNTGTLNVTGWMNLLTDNNGIRGSYDYGDALGVYNARWFEGDFLLAKRMLMFSGDIYNLTASGGKGSYRHTSGTILGNDHLKFRAYHSNNTSNNNIRSRIDISADMIEISDNFNPKAVRASIAANGRAYFEGVATGVINAGEYYNTLKLNSEWRNWLGTITMTSSENGVWINENTGIGNAQMMFGRDSAGARIYSMDLYNRTYSGNAEVVITPAGTLGRRTSARKYKADIITSESVIKNAKKVLELKPVSWLDRAELDRGEAISRYHGFIADEFDSIGLKEVVIYNEREEVEGLAYDRISMYHNVILSDHEDRLKRLERMLIGK